MAKKVLLIAIFVNFIVFGVFNAFSAPNFRIVQIKKGDILQIKSLRIQCQVTDSMNCHNSGTFPRIEWALFQKKLEVWKRQTQVDTSLPIFITEIP